MGTLRIRVMNARVIPVWGTTRHGRGAEGPMRAVVQRRGRVHLSAAAGHQRWSACPRGTTTDEDLSVLLSPIHQDRRAVLCAS